MTMPAQHTTIRPAGSYDAAQLSALNNAFNGPGCSSPAQAAASLGANPQELVLVAAGDEALLGFCCGQLIRSLCYARPSGQLTELYLLPAHRGQGIGRALVQQMLALLCAQGAQEVRVLTGQDNQAARALYTGCGFLPEDEVLLQLDIP